MRNMDAWQKIHMSLLYLAMASYRRFADPVSQALDGSTLDAVDTPEGPGISITTPDSTPLIDDS
jgi:hypothetical protein